MTYLAGLGFSLSLIVAIGAQNVFVLRQGLRREHVLMVVAICAASDAVLIAVGVSGVGAAVLSVPWLVGVARWGGAAFLLGYAVVAARRAWRPAGAALEVDDVRVASGGRRASSDDAGVGPVGEAGLGHRAVGSELTSRDPRRAATTLAPSLTPSTLRVTLLAVLAVTWLNPHVYLDTVLFMGTVASTYGDLRWIFAAGAMSGSVVWFLALGYGARLLSGPLSRPGAWRVLDGVIAAVMAGLAVALAMGA
ncbi:LysE/ArgO family amino acid transporter [Demequina sp. NBRC 110054]|uniref:LysE/ArgO family amino acid transporter n=1 Tax=Demequina sp. NBRC 110054 TaxID=1570343 RepID=UPI000A045D97|nr:LysE/ArgO family amino acid transporter [Demequina sp. NBRC 110054]